MSRRLQRCRIESMSNETLGRSREQVEKNILQIFILPRAEAVKDLARGWPIQTVSWPHGVPFLLPRYRVEVQSFLAHHGYFRFSLGLDNFST
jgi:hypothetical protein